MATPLPIGRSLVLSRSTCEPSAPAAAPDVSTRSPSGAATVPATRARGRWKWECHTNRLHDVLRLDVTVHDPCRVRRRKRRSDLNGGIERLADVHSPLR